MNKMTNDSISEAPGFSYYNEGFVVAIWIIAKEGEGDAVARILDDLVAPTMAEEGVKLFLPYRSPDDKASFFIFELYHNREGWDAHQASSHFKAAIPELSSKVSKRERIPFIPFVVGFPK